MSNSINSFGNGGPHRLAERNPAQVRDSASEKNSSEKTARATDSLDLTGRAKELQTLPQELAKTPEFDAARVSELKEAITNGQYEVNAERIAEKLLAVESTLP